MQKKSWAYSKLIKKSFCRIDRGDGVLLAALVPSMSEELEV